MAISTSHCVALDLENECKQAILRGLDFIYSVASDPSHFGEYGSDLLWCLYLMSRTSKDEELAGLAGSMGRERAVQWRLERECPEEPYNAQILFDCLYGDDAARRMVGVDKSFANKLETASRRFDVSDYLGFDPRLEAPPSNLPDQCACGLWNRRKNRRCCECGNRLEMMSPFGVWCDALTTTYWGENYGIILGTSYPDVIKWLPKMRPYETGGSNADDCFFDAVYAITHVIYTLNDYNRYRLAPNWLPLEFAFLQTNFKKALALEDPEMVGEFMDTLKVFGLRHEHPLIREGLDYLLAVQNDDGSWGEASSEDIYALYHPTWCAIDGLRQYNWTKEGLSRPSLEPLLKEWAQEKSCRP
jgi:hypothetical protein